MTQAQMTELAAILRCAPTADAIIAAAHALTGGSHQLPDEVDNYDAIQDAIGHRFTVSA